MDDRPVPGNCLCCLARERKRLCQGFSKLCVAGVIPQCILQPVQGSAPLARVFPAVAGIQNQVPLTWPSL